MDELMRQQLFIIIWNLITLIILITYVVGHIKYFHDNQRDLKVSSILIALIPQIIPIIAFNIIFNMTGFHIATVVIPLNTVLISYPIIAYIRAKIDLKQEKQEKTRKIKRKRNSNILQFKRR